jgi:predicted RND superfamily exporter protein
MHGRDALRRTHEDVGRALVFATIALMVGFSVLTLSNFLPLVYFGVLVSAAMFGGLIGNLTFFPLLLRWAERDHSDVHETKDVEKVDSAAV